MLLAEVFRRVLVHPCTQVVRENANTDGQIWLRLYRKTWWGSRRPVLVQQNSIPVIGCSTASATGVWRRTLRGATGGSVA